MANRSITYIDLPDAVQPHGGFQHTRREHVGSHVHQRQQARDGSANFTFNYRKRDRSRSRSESRRSVSSKEVAPCRRSSTCRRRSAQSFVGSPSAQRRSIVVRPFSMRKRAPRSRGIGGCIRHSLLLRSSPGSRRPGGGASGLRSPSACGGGLTGASGACWA